MDGPFFEGISLIEETEAMMTSRVTTVPGQISTEQAFHDKRTFASGVLESWGLKLGLLIYSKDNQTTLNSIVQLINFRQKDIAFRQKIKEEIGEIQFEKQKYRSYLEQAKRTIEEKNKNLGRVENENAEIRAKVKKNEVQIKKQRDQDKKLIIMLRNKNEQLLHEIKKKEQEVNRVKEQMKKSVGEKGVVNPKNSFQVVENLVREGISDKKDGNSSPTKRQQEKFHFLIERNETETKTLKRQNNILKQKIFDIKELLVEFTKWIDRQLFGEVEEEQEIIRKYRTKFSINHNLIFKKQSLVEQFREVLNIAKDGILQIQEGKIQTQKNIQKSNKIKSSEFLKKSSDEGFLFSENKSFKKQVLRQDYAKTDRIMKNQFQTASKDTRQPRKTFQVQNKNYENTTPKSTKNMNGNTKLRHQQVSKFTSSNTSSNRNPGTIQYYKNLISTKNQPKFVCESMPTLSIPQIDFEGDLLSEVIQDNDSSIVSHIEPADLIKSNAYDKWDILFREDKE